MGKITSHFNENQQSGEKDPQGPKCLPVCSLKAHTHKPIFRGFLAESAVESADSTAAESADSSTDSLIVGRLSLSNIFDILKPLESADRNQQTLNLSSGYGP